MNGSTYVSEDATVNVLAEVAPDDKEQNSRTKNLRRNGLSRTGLTGCLETTFDLDSDPDDAMSDDPRREVVCLRINRNITSCET